MMGRIGARHATGLSCEFKPNTCLNAPRPDRKTQARPRSARQVKQRARVPCSISSQRARSALTSSHVHRAFSLRSLPCDRSIQPSAPIWRRASAAGQGRPGRKRRSIYTTRALPRQRDRARGFRVGALPYSRCVDQNGPPGITPRVGSKSSNYWTLFGSAFC